MAVAEPRHRAVFDPTRDPDADGPPHARRRYWLSALIGVILLALAIAFVIWELELAV